MRQPTRFRQTQRSRLFQLLKDRIGEWIPAYEIAQVGGLQFGARLLELRASGHVITNGKEWHNGQMLSWYRLETPPGISRPAPASSTESQEQLFDITPDRSYLE